MKSLSTYLNESLEELRHVQWPTRQQAIKLSTIVLVFTFASALAFGFIDFLLARVVQILLSLT